MQVETLHPGITAWVNPHGIRVLRLHYSADPDKSAEWAETQRKAMTDPAMYRQEYEIDFSAKLGTTIYNIDESATLEESFLIPPDWTRYYGLDPHPRVPHASLWMAVDPWGDAWIYRELWPSKIYGQSGNIPEDDNVYSIKDYVSTVKWLESENNPENDGRKEQIHRSVIDYAARAFGKGTSDDKPQDDFQTRFESAFDEAGIYRRFEDAIKDNNTGIAAVNEWLIPRLVEQTDGTFKPKSRLHIFVDRCPELIHELKINRWQSITPLQAERQDPASKPVAKRNHLTDVLRYLIMSGPEYFRKMPNPSPFQPIVPGIAR